MGELIPITGTAEEFALLTLEVELEQVLADPLDELPHPKRVNTNPATKTIAIFFIHSPNCYL